MAEASPPHVEWDGFGFQTRQVHAGEVEDLTHGSRITPVHLSAAYRFASFQEATDRFAGADLGHLYSRNLNPTNQVAERRLASLEGGSGAIVVGSGQAAITTALLALAGSGEHIVSTASIYSGTRVLFDRTFARMGVTVEYVWNPDDEAEWDALIRPETKAIFTETLPNPKNDVVDVAAVARIAKRHGIPLIVDNTIATPFLIRPIEHGADVVVHSATKFLSGHGANLAGAVVDGGTFDWVASDRSYPAITATPIAEHASYVDAFGPRAFEFSLRFGIANDTGPALSPLNGFLLQQGMETLSVRMRQHLASARTIAEWLEHQPVVESVDYAGLPSHPQHALAVRDYGGQSGSVFSFTVRGGRPAAERFFDALRLFSRMTNIGDTRSMALHPATTTHLGFTQETRDRLGIGDGLIRLSIGLEDAEDLIADLDEALRAVA
ncbi:O-acetylhomoserine aminocarboxypropyltransferase/cysteine synthase family protein [Microbacterium testaceum]|uniref:O-acetylhomoserine aminocarboxypropyltransferase/cysteine synthase family protein n=1 Tax=Microbacterium testaceum TaxID=2033 RepID=UPI00073457D3|nr:aminotransferase class I/II-fold pyridoxal phosphate-dependent enzyme [Microbacterium testaceum]KTS05178.1 O-acetylhomoserine aminocarboxypropyltransferase [Microbacterium testaceum]